MKNLNTEIFILKAKSVHEDRYDYSQVIYENCNSKIVVVCKRHGEFDQSPRHHLRGSGCPKCGKKDTLTNEEFIKRSKLNHGNLSILRRENPYQF